MSGYTSTTTIAGLARTLLEAQRIAVTTHSKPDGDAVGSVVALVRALQVKSKQAEGFLMSPVAANLCSLAGSSPVTVIAEGDDPGDVFDVIMVMDTGAWSQVEPLADWLKRHRDRVIGLDHHSNGDDVAPRRVIDPSCASTTQLLIPLLEEMKCELTGGRDGLAEPLFVGLATDTGWFRHPNADSRAFAVAARLLACGVDKVRLHQVVEEAYPASRLALQARALASLEYACDGSVAMQSLGRDDFEAAEGSPEDLTGLVNEPLCVGAVRVSIMLVEHDPGRTKLSFRSKPAAPELGIEQGVDVNVLAGRFGGGGHIHAAGAKIDRPLAEARAMLLEALSSPMPMIENHGASRG